jgi:hypothetical protein
MELPPALRQELMQALAARVADAPCPAWAGLASAARAGALTPDQHDHLAACPGCRERYELVLAARQWSVGGQADPVGG